MSEILFAQENEITWFDDLSLDDLPGPLPAGIRLVSNQQRIGIEASGLVGAIPLVDGRTLRILPKIGEANFLTLLFRSMGESKDLKTEFEEFVSYALSDNENLDYLVARQLMSSVAEIWRRSPRFGWQRKIEQSTFVKGQINPVNTAIRLAQRDRRPVVSKIKSRSYDIPENRVLLEAAMRAFSHLSNFDRTVYASTLEHTVRRLKKSQQLGADIKHVHEGFANGSYGGARGYYQKALMLACVILGNSGLGLDERSKNVTADALLINTADIFEKYLRTFIRSAYADRGFFVGKGGNASVSLYTDGSHKLEPDILISKEGRPILICDAKYKSPGGPDHYQMLAYLMRYRLREGLLLCPSADGNEVVERDYMTPDGLVVREIELPIGNIDVTEAFLGSIVQKFVH